MHSNNNKNLASLQMYFDPTNFKTWLWACRQLQKLNAFLKTDFSTNKKKHSLV